MDKSIIDQLYTSLSEQLKTKFGLEETQLKSIASAGQNSMTATLKTYVLKNGSSEIEQILLGTKQYEASGLKVEAEKELKQTLSNNGFNHEKKDEIAVFSLSHLVSELVKSFTNSNYSKDLDGICGFIGIDKNILKMVNSPMGKMLGKFW